MRDVCEYNEVNKILSEYQREIWKHLEICKRSTLKLIFIQITTFVKGEFDRFGSTAGETL
jgi:hypothetical protein